MKDWNDAHLAGGDILKAGDNAETWREPEPFDLVRLADVVPAEIDWLWEGYLARGKLTLLGGDPDLGKSQLSIDMAARQSAGKHWPFGPLAHIASTVFLCSEDGIADTIRPRADAAGADVSKLYVLRSTIVKDGKARTFTLQNDLDMLGAAVAKVNASLVCIDAVTSYMGKIENNSMSDVRAVLDPISEWAEQLKIAVLGITHPPKAAQRNAIRQVSGSFAYVAAARLCFYVTKDPDGDRNLLLASKNNIGPKALGRAYRIGTKEIAHGIVAPYVQWDDAPVDYTADEAIAANNATSKDGSALEDAKAYLTELLANGPVDATHGKAGAEANGISERTLKRARKELGVKAVKDEFKGGWRWTL
jgi:putative DNA primase/helicase